MEMRLPCRPPYSFERMLAFLSGRAIPGVEKVEGGAYFRTARLGGPDGRTYEGWLRVSQTAENNALIVTLGEGLIPVRAQALARLKHLFDLDCEPEKVGEALRKMDEYKPGLFVPGIRLPGCFEPFETAVRAILGQQVTVKAASAIAGRVAGALGAAIETGLAGLNRAFPEVSDILALGDTAQDRLGALGVTGARGRCIFSLAEALENGAVSLQASADPEREIGRLLAIKGIGGWTARYIAMRVLHWKDAFLETDAGVKKALPGMTPKEMLALAESWRPFRSYAVMCLWGSL